MSKTKHYPQTTSNPDFPAVEQETLKYWNEKKIFERSVDSLPTKKDGGNEFSFFDGPPFANGLPHYGHLLTSCVKDIFARYQTMKGRRAERVFGWDCHGLPAEMEVEKELGIRGQLAIQEYGIGKFNDACRTSVMKYTTEWEHYVNRIGRWVDFDNGYKTMDRNYMESVMWAFSELHKKGLIYEGHKVMPYSWAAETPLSNFETRLDNSYREKVSKSAYVAFELEDGRKILAWTTTPWTLPSNLALAVGKDVKYAEVEKDGSTYIMAASCVTRLLGEEVAQKAELSASNLLGKKYKPLFPYFADDKRGGKNAFTIIEGDFVSDTDGTGIVHIAPGFGEDDQRVAEANGICLPDNGGIICPVDEAGKYTSEIFDIKYPSGRTLALVGLNVMQDTNKTAEEPYKEDQMKKYGLANLRIIDFLKESGLLIKQEDYTHNYPHCWRTDTPLIYKAVPSWYLKVTAFKERMVELNHSQINWIPSHIRDGQFGKWLENAHDWAISRNRFWGSPIPIWRSNNPENKQLYVFGSIKELEEFFGVKVDDLHRPFIDTLTKPDPKDSKYTISRVSEVLDCWFESGAMPFAELHYPFENVEKFECRFPADFIVEYVAQTRGWFYTLMVLSTALFDKAPFKNCICHGVILGEPVKNPDTGKMEKQKLSKRLKNYPDPINVFDTIGADSMRWMMVSSPVMSGGELTVAKDGTDIRDATRLVLKPIWNAYHFFCLYANSDGIKAEEKFTSTNLMDRYILSKLKEAVGKIEESLDGYQTNIACKAVEDFFEVLNNWYIRRSRDRFWSGGGDADKVSAYNTLYTCLTNMAKAAAPLAPYLFEAVFRGLTAKESVHLEKFPNVSSVKDEAELLVTMDKVREICNAGLGIRNKENAKVRQPLNSANVIVSDKITYDLKPLGDIIADELNVKSVNFSYDLGEKAELKLNLNFPVLGKRLPHKVKELIPAVKQGKWKMLDSGGVEVLGEVLETGEYVLNLEPKNKKGAASVSGNDAVIELDLNITDELRDEGIARDVVRAIQQARKDADLNITDRIDVALQVPAELASAIQANTGYISEQTLAKTISVGGKAYSRFKNNYKLDEADIEISFEVAA